MNTAMTSKTSTQNAIQLEEKYGAHNYHPLPVVLDRGEGVFVFRSKSGTLPSENY
jgi:ornithine--oxo-acid transaminase